ncbi:glutamyl-tRNA synthetase [Nematocida major]|uniref:glutamyl-tRNA synthetase n=1 Tax=Nematocida major TaxID=1912982 RepID=UPI002008933D|nr:glutamyl-tRNA synthetase [Nematocida major]KAH9386803.1 glutamyl-tRNA synthetase [Nematocida major]
MLTIICNHSKRHHILAFVLAKIFKGVESVYSNEDEEGFFNYSSLGDLLERIPEFSVDSMEYLGTWKVGMAYAEVIEKAKFLEETNLGALQKTQKILLFFLLYSEMIFVNLLKSKKLKDMPNVSAFYAEQLKEASELIKAYDRQKKQDTKPEDQASFDIGLPAGYKVVTRFPPEPSGYMHIGHAKAALLNQYFAETYNGSMIVRMDDTNPSKEKEEYERTIMEDISMLGITEYKTTRTSDHFGRLFELAKEMIRSGLAYCDNTPVEQMRMERDKGIPSANRNTSPETNLEIFNKMATTAEGDAFCLRAKIDMENLNKAMRDPVIYRVNLIPHHYTGTTYRVYPTYDFACPVVDSLEGITLALRTSEYRDRNAQYMWFISALKLDNRPIIWDFSRLNFKKTVLSKRNLKELVENHLVTGWNDPRMPTIRGITRKGLTKQALKEYVIMQGPSKNTVFLEWDKLWSINAKIVEKTARKIHGVGKGEMAELHIVADTALLSKAAARKVTETVYVAGADVQRMRAGDTLTLMGLGTFIVSQEAPLSVKPHDVPPKETKARLTWIPCETVEARAFEYGDLITVDKMDERPITEVFNSNSVAEKTLLCDERALLAKQGDFVQIEKMGIYIVDSLQPLVLNLVPATKQQNRKKPAQTDAGPAKSSEVPRKGK